MAPARRRAERLALLPGLALLAIAAACAAPPAVPPDCATAGRGAPMLQASLLLGRGIEGRAPVSRAEWEEFAATEVTPRFPDGFTVLDGRGQWRNPDTGALAREDSLVVLVVAAPGPETTRRLEETAAAWRRQFRQRSVGIVTAPVCAAF
jgi:hypothetical protein